MKSLNFIVAPLLSVAVIFSSPMVSAEPACPKDANISVALDKKTNEIWISAKPEALAGSEKLLAGWFWSFSPQFLYVSGKRLTMDGIQRSTKKTKVMPIADLVEISNSETATCFSADSGILNKLKIETMKVKSKGDCFPLPLPGIFCRTTSLYMNLTADDGTGKYELKATLGRFLK